VGVSIGHEDTDKGGLVSNWSHLFGLDAVVGVSSVADLNDAVGPFVTELSELSGWSAVSSWSAVCSIADWEISSVVLGKTLARLSGSSHNCFWLDTTWMVVQSVADCSWGTGVKTLSKTGFSSGFGSTSVSSLGKGID